MSTPRLAVQVNTGLPPDVVDELRAEAELEGITLAAVVRRIVLAELRRRREAAA